MTAMPDLPPEAKIAAWIIEQGLTGDNLLGLLGGLCDKLVAHGIPLWRAYLALPTISPDLRAMNHSWVRGEGVSREPVLHERYDGAFEASPFWPMLQAGEATRRWSRDSAGARTGFPVLDGLFASGATDYAAFLVPFGTTEVSAIRGAAISFATDAAEGFDAGDLFRLGRFVRLLGLAACRFATAEVLDDVLGAYVGREAGRRVLRGEMQRGRGERLHGAILFADLQGFTTAAETGGPDFVTRLGRHLEAMAGPVEDEGGEVLKFLGDGLLAGFQLGSEGEAASGAPVLRAALEAMRRNEEVNDLYPGTTRLGLDVALHCGEVFYGNVGGGTRLDFTVIGPAVNEASRIEALCGSLRRPLLMSSAFAALCGRPTISLGPHSLRGVAEPRELHTLADLAHG